MEKKMLLVASLLLLFVGMSVAVLGQDTSQFQSFSDGIPIPISGERPLREIAKRYGIREVSRLALELSGQEVHWEKYMVTSQPLEMEVSRTVEEYLLQLDLASTQYGIVVSDEVAQGAAVLHWVEDGEDSAVFFFERRFFLQLSRRERRVLIAHEVGHLAPQCQLPGRRLYREICADGVSSKLVPVDEVAAMLAKSIVMFPDYPAQKEFIYRLAAIQENRVVTGGLELKTARLMRLLPEHVEKLDCD